MPRSSRLIVVANRLPLRKVDHAHSVRWERSPGGLVTALEPVLRKLGGAWIGWDGGVGRAIRPFEAEGISLRPVTMTRAEVEDGYEGFCNRTLWPLYHDALRAPVFERDWWERYEDVNRRFAKITARTVRPSDVVWVHDFHLQLVPGMLRQLRPRQRSGFFLHIPFPPEELFAWLPWRRQILEGLLGADIVGFQTESDAKNFSRAARRFTAAEGTDSALVFKGRETLVRTFPISIDTADFEAIANNEAVIRRAAEVRERLGAERRVLLSVERLDYTKGIDTRLMAFEHALKRGVLSAKKTVLILIAVPSREAISEYAQTRRRIEEMVGRINGEYSEPGRVAVHYFRRSLPRDELVAYYLAADVMLVTPLRDGMNLVCKEFVACRTDSSGVLVLSEFAGAARELRRALLVNPRDLDGFVGTMKRAITMPRRDAVRRMSILRMQVRRHDVHDWAGSFLEYLHG